MIGKKLISTEVLPVFEVKEYLKARSGMSELGYEQSQVHEYAKKFAKVTKAKGDKLMEELKAAGIEDIKLLVKIVDILPKDIEALTLLLPKDTKMEDAKLEEIVKIVENYIKK